MKKLHYALAIGAVAGLCLSSCKKGEDDPFLSLRSRDSRITGEFSAVITGKTTLKATSVSGTSSVSPSFTSNVEIGSKYKGSASSTHYDMGYVSSGPDNSFYYYENAEELDIDEGDIASYSVSGDASVSLKIEKDGTYELKYSYTKENFSSTTNGTTVTSTGETEYSNSETGRWYWDNSKKNKSGITFVSNAAQSPIAGTFVITQLKKDDVVMSKVQERSYHTGAEFNETSYDVKASSETKIVLKGK